MKHRLPALILAACLLAPLLAACGGGGTDAAATTAAASTILDTAVEETTEPPLTDNLPEKDMNGWELRALSSVSSGFCVNQPEELTGELINDAIYERNADQQSRFNFKLNIEDVTPSTNNSICVQTLQKAAASGDNAYQLYLPYTKTIVNYADSILPWNDVPYIDYTNPWWYPDATQAFSVGGYQLALSGCFDLCVPSRAECLGFNKSLMAELNFKDNVYDLVREGKWTLDKYIEMGSAAVKDLNGDGKIGEQDRIAITAHWKGYISFFINGFGVAFAEKDKDGFPVFDGPKNEPLINVIEKLQNMLATHPDMYIQESTNNYSSKGQPAFAEGGSLFNAPSIHSWIGSFRDLDFEVGMIPPPKLDESQDRYYCQTAYGHSPTLCRSLPKSEWENLGVIMEAFAFSTYVDLLPVYKDVALKNKAAASPDESEMVDLIWNSIFYDFGVLCWESYIADKIVNELFMKGSTANVSFLTTLQSSVRQYEDALRTAAESMKDLK